MSANSLTPADIPLQQVEPAKKRGPSVFFPNLDGLRFFCFLSVFLYHSFGTDYPLIKATGLYHWVKYILAANGNLGVNFFFVLSGFLITYLLMVEKESYGKMDIRGFYVRRILRIWPLFYFCVLFGFVAFPLIKALFGQVPNETAQWPYYLVFLNNFDFIRHGLPDASILGILWSVAIEEQFYLVWPLLLAILPSRYYAAFFLLIIVTSFSFRFINADNYTLLETHTLSCISDMTIGGLAATLVYFRSGFKAALINLKRIYIFLLYAAVAAVFFFRIQIFGANALTIAADRLVIAILFALVILEQNYSQRSLFKMSRYKFISKLGTYTYGLYCLHMLGILVAAIFLRKTGLNTNVYQVIFLEGGLSLLLTIGFAWFSYTYYESWFLKFKNRFSRVTK